MYPNQQNSRSYFPGSLESQNPFRPNSRPQTPNSYSNTANIQNRSFNKLPNFNPSQFIPQALKKNNNNISRSRVSMGSSCASQLSDMMAEHTDIFPQDIVFLLSNEEKNINKMKQKIQYEKQRVENDFAVVRTEIDHILEDIKISVQAELDLVYKGFITKYAQLKGEVQQLRLLRKQILMSNPTTYTSHFGKATSVSNKDLISQIEKDAEHMRNFKIYGYLGELQKQKLEPIAQIAQELLFIGAAECPFYRNKQMMEKLKDVKTSFAGTIKQVFETLGNYVISPQNLLERQRQEEQNAKTILRQLQSSDQPSRLRTFEPHYPANTIPVKQEKKDNQKKNLSAVSHNEQGALTRWCEQIRLNRFQQIQTDHSDSILCMYFLGGKYIATGSKDATINIYNFEGNKIRTLKGHEASICCLSSFKNLNGDLYLASGSDHGCSSLILWDIRSWTISSKIQAHSAAVTGILDLEDGRHVVTGSYDKKIILFSTIKNQIVQNLNNNKSSVTGLIMTADQSKIITGGLDKSISIWSIIRKKGIVEQLVYEKVIACEELICQMQPSLLKPEIIFCATRDGSVNNLNIMTGFVQKSYSINSNSLVQLVAIEREMNPDCPLLISCSNKDGSLVLTKMDTGTSTLIKLPTNIGIDFGCGIGPKIVLSDQKGGIIGIVNQRGAKQFSLYQIQLK